MRTLPTSEPSTATIEPAPRSQNLSIGSSHQEFARALSTTLSAPQRPARPSESRPINKTDNDVRRSPAPASGNDTASARANANSDDAPVARASADTPNNKDDVTRDDQHADAPATQVPDAIPPAAIEQPAPTALIIADLLAQSAHPSGAISTTDQAPVLVNTNNLSTPVIIGLGDAQTNAATAAANAALAAQALAAATHNTQTPGDGEVHIAAVPNADNTNINTNNDHGAMQLDAAHAAAALQAQRTAQMQLAQASADSVGANAASADAPGEIATLPSIQSLMGTSDSDNRTITDKRLEAATDIHASDGSDASADSEASAMAAVVQPTPVVLAVPLASQPMHATAMGLGSDKKSGDEHAHDASAGVTLQTETPVSTTPTPAPTAITNSAPKPMLDAVLAQNQLAQHGNAMEKAVTSQVNRAVMQHLPNGDRMMVVRLTPPELGTVRIEVIEHQGTLTARLHAEDDGVRLALERFLPAMRQELRASDAPITELSLTDNTQFGRSFTDGNQQNQQQQGDKNSGSGRGDSPRFSLDGERIEPVTARRQTLSARIDARGVDALA